MDSRRFSRSRRLARRRLSWRSNKDTRWPIRRQLHRRLWLSAACSVNPKCLTPKHTSNTSNACVSCTKQAIRCYHPKPTFCDKIKELKLRRNILPIILMCCFYIFSNFSGSSVWDPYIIQVLRAFGTPINPNSATILISCVETVAAIALLLIVKSLGRRKIYLTSIMVLGLCSCGLSGYQCNEIILESESCWSKNLENSHFRCLWFRFLSVSVDFIQERPKWSSERFGAYTRNGRQIQLFGTYVSFTYEILCENWCWCYADHLCRRDFSDEVSDWLRKINLNFWYSIVSIW